MADRAPEPSTPCAIVVFGVTGDLAARKLVPALYALHVRGALHADSVLVGFARSDLDDERLRRRLADAARSHVADLDPDAWGALESRIHYVRGDYDDPEAFARLARRLDTLGPTDHVYYTATPPETYAPIAAGIAEAGLASEGAGFRRLVVEKPFGTDLESAQALNAHLLERFAERQLYRIDHYLAKETAQNLAVLRFANTMFEPMWSNRTIDHVQITMAEPMGMEGRGAFYDAAGVIRDVFQNHLLQLLALVAMEPPAQYDADAVRDEKVKVFRALRCADPGRAVVGQYVAGNGHAGYLEEDDVAAGSRTPTYAAAAFEVRNWRWAGVPFYVRAGKRLECKASEIVLRLKAPPYVPFDLPEPPRADRLVLRIVPDEGIRLLFNAKRPGQDLEVDRVSLDFAYHGRYRRPNPDAYETLLLDVIDGDATLFMRADEVEAQWRVVAPLLAAERDAEPVAYTAGTHGPEEADALLEREGRHWYRPGPDAE